MAFKARHQLGAVNRLLSLRWHASHLGRSHNGTRVDQGDAEAGLHTPSLRSARKPFTRGFIRCSTKHHGSLYAFKARNSYGHAHTKTLHHSTIQHMPVLMLKVAHARHYHRDTPLISCSNDLLVAFGAAGLNDSSGASVGRGKQAISKRKEGI